MTDTREAWKLWALLCVPPWATKRVLFQGFTGKDALLTFEDRRDGIHQRASCEGGDGGNYTDLVERDSLSHTFL